MKNLYNYLYEGILSGSESISGELDKYTEVYGWLSKHMFYSGWGKPIPVDVNNISVEPDDEGKLSIIPQGKFSSDYWVYYGITISENTDIPDIIGTLNMSPVKDGPHPYGQITDIDISGEPSIKGLKNIVALAEQHPRDIVLTFDNCSMDYIAKQMEELKSNKFGLRTTILNNTDSKIELDKIDWLGSKEQHNALMKLDAKQATIEVEVNKMWDFEQNNCLRLSGLHCDTLKLNSKSEAYIFIDDSNINKVDSSGLSDDSKISNITGSRIGNLLELIDQYGDGLNFDSKTKTKSKLKPSDIKQCDILGQELSKGDYILSPAWNSHGSWGNSGLRLACTDIVSLTGLTINNGYKNISHKIVLKVPETEELRINLQEENKTINGQELKLGDIVAYWDANKGYNTSAHIWIGKVEKMGKTITVNGRRTYPNYVYKIDKDWLKKMDVNKNFKDLY